MLARKQWWSSRNYWGWSRDRTDTLTHSLVFISAYGLLLSIDSRHALSRPPKVLSVIRESASTCQITARDTQTAALGRDQSHILPSATSENNYGGGVVGRTRLI